MVFIGVDIDQIDKMAPRGVKSAPGAIELNRHFRAETDLLNLQCSLVSHVIFSSLCSRSEKRAVTVVKVTCNWDIKLKQKTSWTNQGFKSASKTLSRRSTRFVWMGMLNSYSNLLSFRWFLSYQVKFWEFADLRDASSIGHSSASPFLNGLANKKWNELTEYIQRYRLLMLHTLAALWIFTFIVSFVTRTFVAPEQVVTLLLTSTVSYSTLVNVCNFQKRKLQSRKIERWHFPSFIWAYLTSDLSRRFSCYWPFHIMRLTIQRED